MAESTHAEDSPLLAVAAAIARGERIDWTAVPVGADPETTTVLDELRSLEELCRAGHPIPDTWGPFAITGELVHGSYGTVYKAHDGNLGLDVALKVIRPRTTDDEASAARALREARLLAQVNHPNVVRVFWAERLGAEVGISMELIRGQTLHQLVRTHGPFGANEAMLIGIDLCRAVAAVHGARLLHGDIKANNVMRAMGGRTVLMDFGAGHDLKSGPGRSVRQTAGTPIYLAPEVQRGEAPTAASDVYSLGVLLYYLVTGTYHVHAGPEVAPGPRAPRLLRDARPDLSEAFIHVVERAIAERPEDRHATMGAFEAALAHALRSEEPAPVPQPSRARRWLVPLAAALAVGLVGLGTRTWPIATGTQNTTAASLPAAASVLPASAPPVANTTGEYRVEAAFYRRDGEADVRLLSGARVRTGDELSLRIQSSVPVYAYVVNEDDHGEAYLLFPLPDQQLSNPLPSGTRHEMPGIVGGERLRWRVSSAGGREHFLVFVTPEPPSPAFERIFADLPRPSFNRQAAQPLSGALVGALRGVGGLAKAPAAKPGGRLSEQFAEPLAETEETARGVWVRQLTLENPAK